MAPHTRSHTHPSASGYKARARLVLAFLLAIVSLLIGCGSIPLNPAPAKPTQITTSARRPLLGEAFSLQGGATTFVDIPGDARGSALELRFVSVISDSRCPRGVECVVAGDAIISLSASFGQSQQTIELHTTPPLNKALGIIANYQVHLISLDPQPERFSVGTDLAQYTAHLSVDPLLPETATPAALAPRTPTPSPHPIPRAAINACTLVSETSVESLFGQIQGAPQPAFNAQDSSQACTIQTERGVLSIRLVPGDQAVAQAMVSSLQRAGVPLSALPDDPRGFVAFGQNQQQAMLVLYAYSASIAIGLTFSSQAQPADYAQARQHLEELQSQAIIHYAAGDVEPMPTPQQP